MSLFDGIALKQWRAEALPIAPQQWKLKIKDGMQGGGGQLSGAIAMIVGGAIVVGAAIYFGQLNTGWAGGL